MKTLTVVKIAAAAALLSAASAHAAVIDFDATSIAQLTHSTLPGPVNVYFGGSYVEDGFKLQSSLNSVFGPLPNTLFAPDAVNVLYTPAADSYALAASVGATTTMTNVGGNVFTANSIDLAHLLDNSSGTRKVTFIGTKADSSTVTESFNFSTDWSTFTFNSNFTNLTKLSWAESGNVAKDFQVDNIRVSAVPEPETYAMLLAGLGMLGWTSRRRKRG